VSAGAVRRLPLATEHAALGATLAPFAGWEMPLRYGSDLAEHHAVRTAAGLFDVSHMGQSEVRGADAARALERVVVSRVANLAPGRARYTMLCDATGAVVDDLIVSRVADAATLWIVANAANTAAVGAAIDGACAGLDATRVPLPDRALLALQGPRAPEVLAAVDPDGAAPALALRPFGVVSTRLAGVDVLASRTGYTGEDGFELACAADAAAALWTAVLVAGTPLGLLPCGLAARDSLRLEAGLPLHGSELGGGLGPVETGFARLVQIEDRDELVARDALARRLAEGPTERVVGLRAEGRRAPRAGAPVRLPEGTPVGRVTSGLPSPTLGVPIALAAVAVAHAATGTELLVDVRGTDVPVRVVDLPFVRRGASAT
jgi:aminomethyltransferase